MGNSSFTRFYEHAGKPETRDVGNVLGEVFRSLEKAEANLIGGKRAKDTPAVQPHPSGNMEALKNGKLPSEHDMQMMNAALTKSIFPEQKPDAATIKGKEHADNLITHAINGTQPHSYVAAEHHKRHV